MERACCQIYFLSGFRKEKKVCRLEEEGCEQQCMALNCAPIQINRTFLDLVNKSNYIITIKPFKMQTKEVQGKLWSSAPSDWAKYLEPTWIPMYRSVLRQLYLNEEKMLLDAGCGAGLFLSMVIPTGATVHGIDAAPGLLEISKRRLPGVTLMIEDLEAIPFSDETFDYVKIGRAHV